MMKSDDISTSEITLTSGIDGVSDYQQYLEKTSRRNSRGDPSLAQSSPTGNGETQRHNSLVGTPTPTLDQEVQLAVPGIPMLEGRRPAHARKERKMRPHRVDAAEDPHEYPGPLALSLLTVGICLSVFLVSLDRTIVATAIPRITDDFHSSDDVGWYGSAYLVTAGALQPIYGRIFIMFNIKWSFLCALGIFELGSLICGVAPNSVTLIVGRAIAGWGSAGILTGSFVVVAHAVPLQRRPVFSAAVGVMFGLGAIVGPLLGGAFTDFVTWRWCFYFNLPVCGATVVSMILLFRPHKDVQQSDKPLLEKILALDLIGNFLLIVAAVMLFLALQFNEQYWAWGSPRIIGLLVGSGVTAIIFVLWQWRQDDRALLPPSIILQRSVAASCLGAFFIYGTFLIHAYYLPIWFQAVKNDTAIMSGVSVIAYVISNALFSVIAGISVSKIGYFAPPAIIGAAIGTVGCGLLSTLQVDSGPGRWVGYQVVTSAGLGMAVQQGVIAVQTVLTLEQIPIGIAAIISMQSLGGAIFVSVGNNILQNILDEASAANNLPGIDVKAVIAAGATQFRSIVPAESLPALLTAYNFALQRVFIAAIPLSGLAFIVALRLEWRSVRVKKPTLEAAVGPATEYSVHGENLEASQPRRRSAESTTTTKSREKTSFETARTSLQCELPDLPEAAHPRQSKISIPGSWCD